MELPAEISGKAASESNDFTGRQSGNVRDFLVQLAVVFLVSYFFLFAGYDPAPRFL